MDADNTNGWVKSLGKIKCKMSKSKSKSKVGNPRKGSSRNLQSSKTVMQLMNVSDGAKTLIKA